MTEPVAPKLPPLSEEQFDALEAWFEAIAYEAAFGEDYSFPSRDERRANAKRLLVGHE